MYDKFLYSGWNLSKNNNLYKIIDGECYTIIKNDFDFVVITNGTKIKELSSLSEAKCQIYELAYGTTVLGDIDEYAGSEMFREILRLGYRQLSNFPLIE